MRMSVIAYAAIVVCILLLPITHPANAQEKYGGTLVFAHRIGPKHFNQAWKYDVGAYPVNYNVFNNLIVTDGSRDSVIPDLAERWDVSADLKVYTFYLVKNAKWHDGQKFTAADVKWTFEKVISDKGYQVDALKGVSRIDVVDDYTLKITLKEPDIAFLGVLGQFPPIPILPKHLYDGTDWTTNPLTQKPVGTGPFKFEEHVTDSHVTLTYNPEYFKGRPYLDKIIMKIIPSNPVAMAALEAGEVSWLAIGMFPNSQVPKFQKLPAFQITRVPFPVYPAIGYNLRRKPFDNALVREAIAYAINRTEITQKALFGLVDPSVNVFSRNQFKWASNPDAKLPVFNPSKAEELLDQAGYRRGADGIRFRSSFTPYALVEAMDIANIVKESLGKIGIEIRIEQYDAATFYVKVRDSKEFDMYFLSNTIASDPSAWRKYVGTGGGMNYMGYSNPEVDKLFDQGASVWAQEERKKAYFGIQEILRKDMPLIPLYEDFLVHVHRKGYQGWFFESDIVPKTSYMRFDKTQWEGGKPLVTATTTATTKATTTTPPTTGMDNTMLVVAGVALVIVVGLVAYARKHKKGAR